MCKGVRMLSHASYAKAWCHICHTILNRYYEHMGDVRFYSPDCFFFLRVAFYIFNIILHNCHLKYQFWGGFLSKISLWLSHMSHENGSYKTKIIMTYVSKEYKIKTKMVHEQWLKLKMLFLLGYNLKIVIWWGKLTFGHSLLVPCSSSDWGLICQCAVW